MQIRKIIAGTYKRNGYSDAQKRGIKNWSQSLHILGRSNRTPHRTLEDKEFREYRRKVEDIMETEQLLDDTKEVWE